MFLEKLLFAVSLCSSVCVPTCTYFASICKAWKSETQGGLLRNFIKMCRSKHTRAHTRTNTDSSLGLWAVCISACLNGCCTSNRESWGSGLYPRAHHLTLDRWTRVLFFPSSPCFYGISNYAYTPHQNKTQHAIPLVWRGSELVRCNKVSLCRACL